MLNGKFQVVIFLILFYFSNISIINAQINFHSAGFDSGLIDNVDPHSGFFDNPILASEAFICGDFISTDFNWKLNLGYWNDEQNEPRYSDHSNYSYSSILINAEIIYLTPYSNPEYPSPIRFLAGLSSQYLSAKDVDRYESTLVAQKDYKDKLLYFNSGVELHLFLQKHLSIFTKGLVYFHIKNSEVNNYKSPRFELSLGLNYQFGNKLSSSEELG